MRPSGEGGTMYRLRAWGGVLVLLAGLGALAKAGEPADIPPAPAVDPGLTSFRRWSGPLTEKPKPAAPAAAKPRPSETAGALRAQEEANLWRRTAVCDKLRDIGLAAGDEKLQELADQLQ